jgi:hypothetical protein
MAYAPLEYGYKVSKVSTVEFLWDVFLVSGLSRPSQKIPQKKNQKSLEIH